MSSMCRHVSGPRLCHPIPITPDDAVRVGFVRDGFVHVEARVEGEWVLATRIPLNSWPDGDAFVCTRFGAPMAYHVRVEFVTRAEAEEVHQAELRSVVRRLDFL